MTELCVYQLATFATEERMSPETKSDLERDLSSAVHMAYIAVNLVEKALRAAQENATGRSDTYHVNVKDVEALVQALFETRNQIRAARDRYLRTLTEAPR
jgi:coenzyme F420-reducing hydrogenase alpha subunit